VAHDGGVGALRVRLLGPLEVEGVEPARLGPRQARTVLKILALARGRPVPVDRLADCLWPHDAPARPASQVAVLVSRLRHGLGAATLARTDAGYALALAWLDVDALAELGAEADRRLAAGSPILARAAAGAALALVRGPLLADEPDAPWAEPDRAAADRLVARVRHGAARAALALGAWPDAAELGRQALEHDPYDEPALQVVMAALASSGRPASALAAYAAFRARLGEELGVDPGPATEELHTAILLGRPLPGVPGPGAGPAPAPAPPAVPGRRRPLPGRAAEMAALDAALDRARAGVEVVVVEGEAGIGKSRLLAHWAGAVQAAGGTVLRGGCDELGRVLPLQAVLDALRAHLPLLGPAELAEVLGPDAPLLGPLLAAAGAATALGTGPGTAPGASAGTAAGTGPGITDWLAPADPAGHQAALFAALLRLLGRLPGDPPVLVLEDVHLADASTLAWLAFAGRRRHEARALLVASRRTGEGGALPALSAATVLHLGPIDLAAAEQVVGPARAGELHRRSGGNPLLLVELAAAGPGEAVPASLVEAVTARCGRTGEAGATLQAAAVIGPEIDLDLLAAVLARPPVELLGHLEQGARHQFLEERGARFAFRHDLVREALAAGTGPSRRAVLHREAGRALAARPSADPRLVAYHARLGGDDDLAAAALARAAVVAADRHDLAEAHTLLDQAVAVRSTPAALLERARVRLALGRYREAGDDAGAALAQGAGAPAFELAGWAAYYQRDFERARSLADDGARLGDDARVQAACLALAGRIRHSQGDLAGAADRLERAVELAQGAVRPVASTWLGSLRVHQGRAGEALELLRPATRPGPALVHPFAAVHARLSTGHALALTGQAAEALAAFAEAEAEITRQGAGRFAGRAPNYRAWVLRNLGAGGEAEELNGAAADVAGRDGLREPLAHALLDLATARLDGGDLDGAAGLLERAGCGGEPFVNRWRSDLRARLLGARLALATGAAEEAWAAAEGLRDDARAQGAGRYVALARLLEARSRAAAGERVDVDAVGDVLRRLDRLAGMEAWWLTAEAAAALGVDPWWAAADRRLAALAAAAGPYAGTLTRWAGTRLESIRTVGRRG
jgi:DNA-binding SARP family transcriptional activator